MAMTADVHGHCPSPSRMSAMVRGQNSLWPQPNGVPVCKAEGCEVKLFNPQAVALGLCIRHQGTDPT
jgi:hypothetical protein